MIEFDTTMTERDFRSLVYYTSFSKHTWVPSMMVIGMGVSLLVVITWFFGAWAPSIPLLIAAGAYAVGIPLLMVMTDRNIAKTLRGPNNPTGRTQHISADQKGFTCRIPSEKRSRTYLWESLAQIYETKEYFFIYVQGRSAFVFNKQAMGSASPKLHNLLKDLHSTKYNDRTTSKIAFFK